MLNKLNAIVIKRNLDPTELDHIYLLSHDKNYKIFSDIDLPAYLNTFVESPFTIDAEAKRNLNYQLFNKVNDFGDKNINDKTISELLSFERAGIWHYHKFRIYFFTLNLSYELNEINYYSENFDKIQYYTSNENLKFYSNIPSNCQIIYCSGKKKNKINFISLLNYLILIKLKLLFFLFCNHRLDHRKHIIIDHSQKQSCLDLKTLKIVKGNYNLHYLLDKIDENFIVINEDVLPKFKDDKTFKITGSILPHKKAYHEYPSELILLKGLLNFSIRRDQKYYAKKLQEKYKLIEESLQDNDDKLILRYLVSLHKSSLYYLFRYSAFKTFFSKHKFKTLTTIDENSPIFKSIIYAAKDNNIITLGIQHGNIHELHPAYIFTKSDNKNRVMSDFTFVWGKYYRNFLVDKGNYPDDSLITIGQLRTDIIPVLLQKSNDITNHQIISSSNHHIILFASQPQRDAQLRYASAFDVFTAVKDNADVTLIIKLHPAELNDIKYYESIALEAGCTNYKIIYYYDLYLLLSKADIVITCFSTVGTEAVYFHKPLIILDHLKQDIQNYHKCGVAFQATNAEELKTYINDILNGHLKINDKAYYDFIDNYAYKIDGKVAERCIQFIRSLE